MLMVRPEFKIVRSEEQFFPFDRRRLIGDVVDRIRNENPNVRVFDENIGFGFSIETSRPTTLKDFLFRRGSFHKSPPENLNRVKSIING